MRTYGGFWVFRKLMVEFAIGSGENI